MKSFDIFGFQFSFDYKWKNRDDIENYSAKNLLNTKIFYLILIFSIFSLSSKIDLFNRNRSYEIGQVVTSDVFAPKSVVYKDRWKKSKIIEEIIADAGKEYLYVPGAEAKYTSHFNFFVKELKRAKEKKEPFDFEGFREETGIVIPEYIVVEFLKLNIPNINRVTNDLKRIIISAYRIGIFKDEEGITYPEEEKSNIDALSVTNRALVKLFLVPTYIYDEEATKESVRERISNIEDPIVEVNAGDLIIKKGEIISESHLKLLENVGIYSMSKHILVIALNVLYLIIAGNITYLLSSSLLKRDLLNKKFFRSTLLVTLSVFLLYSLSLNRFTYLVPFELIPFTLLLFTNSRYSLLLSLFSLLYVMPIVDYNAKFFMITSISTLLGCFMVSKVKTRAEIITVGVKIAITKALLYMLLGIFLDNEPSERLVTIVEILASGILSSVLTLALMPYIERTFNLLNIFKLLELGDLSNPLLRRLSVEAPGTFYHSIMVATLSENAALEIKADSIFCRVSSYYHDIGKIKRPNFYIENQNAGNNPHDKLSPFMSNMIIKAHVKEGVQIGKEYKIPREIRDIMVEHQGTVFLAYFYNKAKVLDPSVRPDDFRYEGPKPKSKESAIIMLADTIEAAVRSIDVKTHKSVEEMVRRLINAKIEDKQLSEANLTFSEIEIIIDSFIKTLMSIHHVRIKYPGQK